LTPVSNGRACNSISTDFGLAILLCDPAEGHGIQGDRPEREVDILIVGSGPTGLTLAAQLAAFPDIKTVLVEQKPRPLQLGQADGIACRSVEMFEAYDAKARAAWCDRLSAERWREWISTQ
jgi:hypothetical protein